MKRFGLSTRARYFGGGLAVVAFVALTLFVVLPAFASNSGDKVPPASGAGVTPVDVGVGGNQSCSSQGLFSPDITGAHETTDPSPPQSGTAMYPSGQGWNFKLTAGALPGFNANKGQSLAVDSQGHAAIIGIAIKGGTDNLAYDYRNIAPGWVPSDTLLHAPASKFTNGTNPESGITQYYGVSQLVICWKPAAITTISGNASVSGNPPAPGLNVTLTDTGPTTPGTQTAMTDGSGNYSFQAVPGDNYTVCIASPGSTYVQTVPATDGAGGSCTAGTKGYSIANLQGASSGNNFAFQPTASITAKAFLDNNGDGLDNSGDVSAATGVQLFDSHNNPIGSQQTTTGGLYTFSNLAVGQTYEVCVVTPSGGSYKETVPTSSSTNEASCPTGYASIGYSFTLTSSGQTVSFGFQPLKSITVNTFFDNNGNGSNDTGDTAASTGVQLFDGSGNPIGAQQMTSAGGSYTFSNLPINQTYEVCAVTPGGGSYNETVPTSSTANEASCPAGYASIGYSFTLTGDTPVSFGFQPIGSLSGTVYQDNNGPAGGGADGKFESNLDTVQPDWGVTLYNGSDTVVGTTTSDANGQYSFSLPFDPTQTYTVCVTPPPMSGAFGQSEPLPTSADNCAQPELQKGQTFQPSSSGATVTENFGVDPAVPEGNCPPGPPTTIGFDNTGSGGSALQIKLAGCKANPQSFVFDSGAPGDPNFPWVSVWAADQTQPLVPLIEKIVFPDPIVNGAPKLQHIAYTDVFPYDPAAAQQMAFCQLDPRDPAGGPGGMTLAPGFLADSAKSQVLPATNAGPNPAPATSCLISLRTYVDANKNSWLEAYVYTDIDGFSKGIG
jgi:hypothetical protein